MLLPPDDEEDDADDDGRDQHITGSSGGDQRVES